MNKTISASLSQTSFIFDEAAYQKLEKYLKQVENFFKDNPDKKEILEDVLKAKQGTEVFQFCVQFFPLTELSLSEDVQNLTKTNDNINVSAKDPNEVNDA